MIQAKAMAATVPTAPSSAPATPAPITTPVEWRRSGGWCAAGGGAGVVVLMSSFVVMVATVGAAAEVDLKEGLSAEPQAPLAFPEERSGVVPASQRQRVSAGQTS
ncbi:hypothetical protein MOKP4_17540 [Mycobacterium avium subsp. hominissuis]|uniref:Uncharacterized protein n=1 Tax=Mycobacterium avium subsp. hominissuis TaxID=439334 RepID=A0AAI8SPB1_MYCAV|nr:hypothetical protein JPH1_32680 [Mycobacterium avium subsp. hominissuis]